MESQHQKWVSLSYLAVAGLVGYVVLSVALKLGGMYDLEARVRNIDLIFQFVAAIAGMITFLALYKNAKSNQFMNEVVLELSRVTWPTQKDTASATVVVIVMVIISGVVLGLLDYCWIHLLKWVL